MVRKALELSKIPHSKSVHRQTDPQVGFLIEISLNSVYIFRKLFLRWRREIKLVILSTMNTKKNYFFPLFGLLYHTLIQPDFLWQNKNFDFWKVQHTLPYMAMTNKRKQNCRRGQSYSPVTSRMEFSCPVVNQAVTLNHL